MVNEYQMEIANIVASGDFDVEIDLGTVATSANLDSYPGIGSVEHSRRQGNRLNVRFDTGSLGILSPNGIYIITGAKTYSDLYDDLDYLLNSLRGSEVVPDAEADNFEIRNLVIVEELEAEINLNALAVGIGLEQVEYEPEQFPGLVYRPEESNAVLLVFSSGKVVITGARDEETAIDAFSKLQAIVTDFFK